MPALITFIIFITITILSPIIMGTLYIIEADASLMRGVSSVLLLLILISVAGAALASMMEHKDDE